MEAAVSGRTMKGLHLKGLEMKDRYRGHAYPLGLLVGLEGDHRTQKGDGLKKNGCGVTCRLEMVLDELDVCLWRHVVVMESLVPLV